VNMKGGMLHSLPEPGKLHAFIGLASSHNLFYFSKIFQ
jgi:hypothetical protein